MFEKEKQKKLNKADELPAHSPEIKCCLKHNVPWMCLRKQVMLKNSRGISVPTMLS